MFIFCDKFRNPKLSGASVVRNSEVHKPIIFAISGGKSKKIKLSLCLNI
jgi:hypothetical protein